jgi:hypothetical protein
MIVNVAPAADNIAASLPGYRTRLRLFRWRFPTKWPMPSAATGMSPLQRPIALKPRDEGGAKWETHR